MPAHRFTARRQPAALNEPRLRLLRRGELPRPVPAACSAGNAPAPPAIGAVPDRKRRVVLSPWSKKLPPEVVALAEKACAGIVAGPLHPFTGPINRQNGSPRHETRRSFGRRRIPSPRLRGEG